MAWPCRIEPCEEEPQPCLVCSTLQRLFFSQKNKQQVVLQGEESLLGAGAIWKDIMLICLCLT